ncbi:MAG: hypothetical protein GYA23_08720 [Methanomicrobiales archaeon]|nr:hypothetical protein [Methanomicrobiales archaeon]
MYPRSFVLGILGILLLAAFCCIPLCTSPSSSDGGEGAGPSETQEEAWVEPTTPSVTYNPAGPKPVRLIFIHHSTGENWLTDDNGDLGKTLMQNNYYVSDTNYGWGPSYGPDNTPIGDMTDIGQYWAWFRSPQAPAIMDRVYREDAKNSPYTRFDNSPGGENEIIMIKSCFPNSALQGNANDPVPAIADNPLKGEGSGSEFHTVANAKGIYLDLLEYFKTRPDKLFIIVTAPPLSDGKYANNARAFNEWLTNDYLNGYSGKNVYVYDFYNVMTSNGGSSTINDAGREGGNHHRIVNGRVQHKVESGMMGIKNTAAYASGWDDDHPTSAGSQKATTEFVPYLNYVYAQWKAGK